MADSYGKASSVTPAMRAAARGGGALVAVQWSEALVRGLYVLLIARVLGPEQFGLWSYALAAYTFLVSLTLLGAELSIPARIGRDGLAAKPVIDASFTLRVVMLLAACAILPLYGLLAEGAGEVRLALFLLLPAVLGRGLALWARPVFTGFERAGLALRIGAPIRFAELGIGAAILFADGTLAWLLLLHGASWLVEAGLCLVVMRRTVVRPQLVFDMARLGRWLRESLPLGLAAGAAGFLTTGPLILLRYRTDGLVEVGQFGLALQVAMFGVMAVQGMLGAAMPAISRAHNRADERLPRRALAVVGATGLGFVLIAALAALLGPPVVALVFGDRFALAGELLPALVLFAGASVLPHVLWQMLVLRGRSWSGVAANLVGCAVLVAVLPTLVTQFGVVGAAYAGIAAWLLRAGWLAVALLSAGKADDQKPT